MEKKDLQPQIYKFTYHDNNNKGIVVFECFAAHILEADKLYQEKIGKNPEKQNHVGCTSEKKLE